MVLFDATVLSLLLHPGAKPPLDYKGNPIERCRERVEHFVETLDQSKTKVIIPTPALSELLVIAGPDGPKYLDEITSRSCFKISDFDQRAAIEAAIQIRDAKKAGDKRQGAEATWAKAKFDRQIVAIAKVEGVQTIYSDDEDVQKYGRSLGIEVKGVESLPLPPPKQLALEEPNAGK
jgi:predicted nucleic acid-binding protein